MRWLRDSFFSVCHVNENRNSQKYFRHQQIDDISSPSQSSLNIKCLWVNWLHDEDSQRFLGIFRWVINPRKCVASIRTRYLSRCTSHSNIFILFSAYKHLQATLFYYPILLCSTDTRPCFRNKWERILQKTCANI